MLGVLFVVALLLRLPNLASMPRFTDEVAEALYAWRVGQGELRPLTHLGSHMGVVYPYLLGALFRILGPHPLLPRYFVAAASALAAPATYLLGRSVVGRAPAALASLAFALSGPTIVVNAHIAYSSSLAPLFVALAIWRTARLWRRAGLSAWLLAGLAWGLALQTHPSAFPLLPGVILLVAFGLPWAHDQTAGGQHGPARLRHLGALVVGLIGLLVGYGNMIVYNLTSGLGTLQRLQARPEYYGTLADPSSYLHRLSDLAAMLSSTAVGRPTAGEEWPLIRPLALGLLLGLAVAYVRLVGPELASAQAGLKWPPEGTARADRSLRWLPVATVLSAVMVMPVLNPRYGFPNGTRYLCPVLPPLYVMMAAVAVRLWRRLPLQPRWRPTGKLICSILLSLWLMAPLLWLRHWYAANRELGATNDGLLALVAEVQRLPLEGPVLVDERLKDRKAEGGGRLDWVTAYLLTMSQVPHEVVPLHRLANAVAHGRWPTMLLSHPTYLMLAEACYPETAARFSLRPARTAFYHKWRQGEWSIGLFLPAAVPLEP